MDRVKPYLKIRSAAGGPGGRWGSVVLGWRALCPPRVVFVLGFVSLINSLTSGKTDVYVKSGNDLPLLTGGNRFAAQNLWLRKVRESRTNYAVLSSQDVFGFLPLVVVQSAKTSLHLA